MESIPVSNDRLTKLETEVEHVQRDVGEIKGELSDIRAINKNVAESLARLAVISEQNHRLEGKLDDLGGRVSANEKFIWKATAPLRLSRYWRHL